jgi:glycosyltransferase involved in cell wall biosynthesis
MTQTYPVKECVIVDDASPDDSIAKCEKLIAGYNGLIRFIILHHERNRGLSAARNTGTDAAQGDYIFYLDSDDEITPDCIEKMARPIERDPSIEMVQGNRIFYSDTPIIGGISQEEEFASSKSVRDYFFNRNVLPVMAWNKLISKKFLTDHGLYFMEGILYEDNAWTFYMVKHLQHLHVIPDITCNHYKRPLSITTGTGKIEAAHHLSIIYEDIARHFTPGEEAREAKYYLRSYFSCSMRYHMMEGYQRTLPLYEKAMVGNGYRKERFLLWVLKLSFRSGFLRGMLAFLVKIYRALLYSFRRLATLWNKH